MLLEGELSEKSHHRVSTETLQARLSGVFIWTFQIGQICLRVHKTLATAERENYKDLDTCATHLLPRTQVSVLLTLRAGPTLRGQNAHLTQLHVNPWPWQRATSRTETTRMLVKLSVFQGRQLCT